MAPGGAHISCGGATEPPRELCLKVRGPMPQTCDRVNTDNEVKRSFRPAPQGRINYPTMENGVAEGKSLQNGAHPATSHAHS